MFCTRGATVSALFVLLTAEMFNHCSAQDELPLPSVGVDQESVGGLRSLFGISRTFNDFNPALMMGQLTSMNIAENIPKYTETVLQATKQMTESFRQIGNAMGIPETAPEE